MKFYRFLRRLLPAVGNALLGMFVLATFPIWIPAVFLFQIGQAVAEDVAELWRDS